jgi:hypothetical protein
MCNDDDDDDDDDDADNGLTDCVDVDAYCGTALLRLLRQVAKTACGATCVCSSMALDGEPMIFCSNSLICDVIAILF